MTKPLRRPCARRDRTTGSGGLRYAGRGLCGACWTWCRDHGCLDDYPRGPRTNTEDTVQRFNAAKSVHPGWSCRRVSEHLNIPYTALRKALSRARRTTQQAR